MPMLLSLLLLLATPLPALAVTVFDDGGVHVIDGPGGAVEVLNGTTVLTVPGAAIGAIASTDSTVGVFGGSIDGHRVDDEFTIINGPEAMFRTLLQKFVELYAGNPFAELRDQLAVWTGMSDLPDPPERGDLELEEVLESKWAFA